MIKTSDLDERQTLMRLTKAGLVDVVMRLQNVPKDTKELRRQLLHLETDNERLTGRLVQTEACLKGSVEEAHRSRNYNETRNAEEVANLRGQIEALDRVLDQRNDSCSPRSPFHGMSHYRPLQNEQVEKIRRVSNEHTQQLHNLTNRITAVEEVKKK